MHLKMSSGKFGIGLNVLTLMQVMGAVRQQLITCVNADPVLCRHIASPGNNELN